MRRQLGLVAWRQATAKSRIQTVVPAKPSKCLIQGDGMQALDVDQTRGFQCQQSLELDESQPSGRGLEEPFEQSLLGHSHHHPFGARRHLTAVRGFAASAVQSSGYVSPVPAPIEGTLLRSRYVPPGGFLALNNIRDNPGAKKEKKRLGRGTGSGLGKTSGRGHKGQKARTGRKPRAGFEGGQTPLRLSIPKRGFHNPFTMDFQVLNLNRLHDYIDRGKIDANNLITMKTLKDAGAIGKAMRDGVKLLGRGSDDFKHPIKIEVSRVSEQARKTIEAAGGNVTTVHYNKLGLRALYKPEWFVKKGRMIPRPARPPPKLRGKVDTVGRLPAPTTPLEISSVI